MEQRHDPGRHANYLRQILSHDKKPLGLFLGAGCPQAIRVGGKPLIPDLVTMTELILVSINELGNEITASMNSLVEQLVADGLPNPNLEDILTRIRSLREVAGLGEVRGFTHEVLSQLDETICSEICTHVAQDLPHGSTPYHNVAVWIDRIKRADPVEVFTPNYDLLMEQAFEDTHLPFFDGFVGSRRTFFDLYAVEEDVLPVRWARLWKIHGSMNWRLEPNGDVSRGEKCEGRERLIHPSHLKYLQSRKMPYLALMDRLKEFFRKPSPAMIVCGYSFSDEHINQVIRQGLEGNAQAICYALLFKPLADYPKAIQIAAQRSNLTLVAPDEAIVGTKRLKWADDEEIIKGLERTVAFREITVGADADARKSIEVTLGDYQSFGEFLLELVGSEGLRHPPEAAPVV
jgi:hypothetical protein